MRRRTVKPLALNEQVSSVAAVGDGRGEVVEAADDGVNLFGGT
jgi:hypothetical protein